MIWKSLHTADGSVDKYAIRSECGQYTVAKFITWGKVTFHASHKGALVKADKDVEIVKQACVDHAAKCST